ncbi:MAG: Uma2 family endonuclease [Isosphaeraceae bacterium]
MTTGSTFPATESGEQRPVLGRTTWDRYQAVLEGLGDRPGSQITDLDGRLTLATPNRTHDRHENAIGRLVEAVATGLGISWDRAGHATFLREDLAGGVEGDDTYYFGANARIMRGPVDVDPASQPPPDLAIEVELTNRADDSAAVCGRIGVPEVWRLDLRQGSLNFGRRREDSTDAVVETSVAFHLPRPADVLDRLRLVRPWEGRVGGRGFRPGFARRSRPNGAVEPLRKGNT